MTRSGDAGATSAIFPASSREINAEGGRWGVKMGEDDVDMPQQQQPKLKEKEKGQRRHRQMMMMTKKQQTLRAALAREGESLSAVGAAGAEQPRHEPKFFNGALRCGPGQGAVSYSPYARDRPTCLRGDDFADIKTLFFDFL